MNRDDLIAHLRFARENMCLNCTYDDILDQAIEIIKALDVTPEELERLKKCRHDCKIECLLKEYDRVKNERDALLKAQEPPTVRECKDLQVLRDIKSGKVLKSGCKDYVIYNGDWYRKNKWDWPEKAQEPRLVTYEDFHSGREDGGGAIPCWEEARSKTRRSGWAVIVYGKMLADRERGVARYWTARPTEEQMREEAWPGA